jgi:hypothetical protein
MRPGRGIGFGQILSGKWHQTISPAVGSVHQRIRRFPIKKDCYGQCRLWPWELFFNLIELGFSQNFLICLVLRQELGGQLMQRQVNDLGFVNTQYISQTFGRCAGHASCAVLRAITEGDLGRISFHVWLLQI